jgi:hypothetical protein
VKIGCVIDPLKVHSPDDPLKRLASAELWKPGVAVNEI